MALFNYCFAKKHGGQFLLRIEDTDQVRSTAASERMILDALRWLGLTWDEGPDIGGPHAPYRQSERSEIYKAHADQLLHSGHAFRCFCTAEDLTEMRQAQKGGEHLGYDGRCARLSAQDVQARLDEGRPFVVRMKVPREGQCMVHDLLRGPIAIDWSTVDMQVLLKSDGLPTYHLANVVDDHLMGITHVIRGEEWLSSAPKHLLLYSYFGWQAPQLCHMPLLRNPDRSKLSKRKNPTSILYYQRMGYLPEAVLNYLGQMAWSMPDAREKFSLQEMMEHFDLERVSLGGPVFDIQKLAWLNGKWIRENLTDAQLGERVVQWALNPDFLMTIAPLVKGRVDVLSDLGPMVAYLFSGLIRTGPEAYVDKNLDKDRIRRIFQSALWRFDRVHGWDKNTVEQILRQLSEQSGVKLKFFLRPFYIAIAGSDRALPLFDSMALLGKDVSRARIRAALDVLGGVSDEELEQWAKEA